MKMYATIAGNESGAVLFTFEDGRVTAEHLPHTKLDFEPIDPMIVECDSSEMFVKQYSKLYKDSDWHLDFHTSERKAISRAYDIAEEFPNNDMYEVHKALIAAKKGE